MLINSKLFQKQDFRYRNTNACASCNVSCLDCAVWTNVMNVSFTNNSRNK